MADGGGANYGLEQHDGDVLLPSSRGQVIDPLDRTLPYQAWARAERIDRELPHRGYDDPTAHCFPSGVPRAHYVPAPFHVLQPPGYVVVLHERMAWRQIALDGRNHPPDQIRLWHGHSVGRWEGDTLVVDTTQISFPFLDGIGTPMSENVTMVERYTLSEDETRLQYEVTVTDPENLLEPAIWENTWVYRPGIEVRPFECTLRDTVISVYR